jgi:BirA family biotin operon repressor/biotin-[acetyl-CoA-carboxylase] ligase
MPLRIKEVPWHHAGTQNMTSLAASMTESPAPSQPPLQHQHWGGETLWQQLEPLLPGLSIEVVARAESTNSALIERVRTQGRNAGEPQPYGRRQHDLQPCLLVAEHQSHGRGRMGRAWHSTNGGSLTFSLAIPLDLADWSGLSLVVGLALAEALEPLSRLPPAAAPRLGLKWPNDLWLDGRKLGGVLIETVPAGEHRMAIIGVGLNIAPAWTNAESLASLSSGFACVQELNPQATGPQVLALIAQPLVQALLDFQDHGFGPWQARYAQRDVLKGRAVTAGPQEGVAQGVSPQGELMLQTAQGLQAVNGGEVSVRLAGGDNPTR